MKRLNGLDVKKYIYKEESRNRWIAEISWKDRNNQERRKRITSLKSKTIVKNKADEFINNLYLANGCFYNEDDITFEQYAKFWLENTQKIKLKPTSYLRKDVTLRNQIYPNIGYIPINKITRQDVQGLINKLDKQGLSFSTIKKVLNAIDGCITEYRLNGHEDMPNPCERITLPENKRKNISDTTEYFSKDECNQICKEATRFYNNGVPVYRLGYSVVLLLYTGMRIGELLALTWNDVDFNKLQIKINKNSVIAKIDGKYQLINQDSTKTYSGKRIISINKHALEALKYLYLINKDNKYVMSTKSGKQVLPSNMNRMFHCILKRTDLSNDLCGVHRLRHTFASMIYKNGCPSKTVSTILGHSDSKITENIYIHVIQELQNEAIMNTDNYCD